MLCRKIFGLSLSATAPENGRQAAARKEAAAKVAANRSAIIGDLLKNSGIVRSKTNQYGNTLRVRPLALCVAKTAVGRPLCSGYLLTGLKPLEIGHRQNPPVSLVSVVWERLMVFKQQAYAGYAAGCQRLPHGALTTGSGSGRVCSTPPVQLAGVWCDTSLLPRSMPFAPACFWSCQCVLPCSRTRSSTPPHDTDSEREL